MAEEHPHAEAFLRKARTRRFFNNFPVRKKPIFKIKLFIRFFVLWYNFIRPHQTLKRPPAIPTT
ncbi:MAG: hypothetical protein QXX95_01090 [Nitrososphaerales archaeon]